MPDERALLDLARQEAEAIVAEAREQADRLLDAARRKAGSTSTPLSSEERAVAAELADSIERSIEQLNLVLDELRRQIEL